MRYLDVTEREGRYIARLAEAEEPRPRAGEVAVRVAASGVNRADLSQIAGKVPAAAGGILHPRPGSVRADRRNRRDGVRAPGRRRPRGDGRGSRGPGLSRAAPGRSRRGGGHSRGVSDGLRQSRGGSASGRRGDGPDPRGRFRRRPRGDRAGEGSGRPRGRHDPREGEAGGSRAGRRRSRDRHVRRGFCGRRGEELGPRGCGRRSRSGRRRHPGGRRARCSRREGASIFSRDDVRGASRSWTSAR